MSQRSERISFCTSRDGARIAFGISGSGPPLLLVQHWIHRLDLDWDSPIWRPWLELLTRRHTVIRHDWRGCGLSDRDGVEISSARYVEDLEAVIEAAGLEQFGLLGMAHGTRVAMTYAAHNPERVSRLVLYQASTCGRGAQGRSADQAEEERTRLKAMELGWQVQNPVYDRVFTALHLIDGNPEQVRACEDILRRMTSSENAIALQRTFHLADVREDVPKVRCPTLVLNSRGDPIVPFEQGRQVAALIQGAHFVPLESRNHLVLDTETAWAQLVKAIDEFLPAGPPKLGQPLGSLSARESDVLELVARGLGNRAIADRLGIAEKTVRNHVTAVLGKLGVNSRAQAIVSARDAGFGQRLDS